MIWALPPPRLRAAPPLLVMSDEQLQEAADIIEAAVMSFGA